MAAVAAAAGVSQMTVSRYFKSPEKLAPATRERVREAISETQYIFNALTANLIHGVSRTVAFLTHSIDNPFYITMAVGIEEVLRKNGFLLYLGTVGTSGENSRTHLELVLSHRIAGAILDMSAATNENMDLLKNHNVPVVLVDQSTRYTDSVRGDSYQAGKLLATHLCERGFRDIAFVGGPADKQSLKDRLRGYKDVLYKHNLKPTVLLGSFDKESGRELTSELLERSDKAPEAIIAANNYVAVGCYEALKDFQLSVPEDIALAAFDELEMNILKEPFLTVVAQPAYEIGAQAAKCLLNRVEGSSLAPRNITLPVELRVRQSTTKSERK